MNALFGYIKRWLHDLRELTADLVDDPWLRRPGRSWLRDFTGEISTFDNWYSAFLVVLTLIPAAIVAYLMPEPQWRAMARLFGAPLQAVISGLLTSALLFMGSHLNHAAKPFSVAHKLMLRIMSIYPLLGFLGFVPWGPAVALLIYGAFVIRGVRKTYPIPLLNALLFYGLVYLIFALLQFQNSVGAPPPGPGLPVDSAEMIRAD